MAKTTPTGVTVTRSKNEFSVSWSWSLPKVNKKDDSVTDQKLTYILVKGNELVALVDSGSLIKGTRTFDIAKNVHKKNNITINLSAYHGRSDSKTLSKIIFVVQGKTKRTSGWKTAVKEFTFAKPPAPTVSVSSDGDYTRIFAWSATQDTKNHKPIKEVEYQTVLVTEPWMSNTSEMNDYMDGMAITSTYDNDLTNSKRIQERSGVSDDKGNLRIFRIRTCGAGGHSAWVTKYVLYAKPFQAGLPYAKVTRNTAPFTVTVWFDNPNNAAHKIDSVEVQWQIATPLSGMRPPASGWNVGRTIDDYKKSNQKYTPDDDSVANKRYYEERVSWEINSADVGLDECLFVRILNKYGIEETASEAVIAAYGKLTAPSIVVNSTSQTEGTVNLTVTNNSSVPSSYVHVQALWYLEGYGMRSKDLDDISGSGAHTDTYRDLNIEEWGGMPDCYEAMAWVDVNGVKTMNSSWTQTTSNIPSAPELTVEAGDKVGVAHIDWEWLWDEADQMEVSWGDYSHAWESTDEPDTHEVEKVNSSELYVTGLETGIPWYFRGRYISGYGDEAIYGPYSEQYTITLESAPNIPSLVLSKYTIAESGETKASWVYTTQDNSTQQKAELAEYDIDNNTYTICEDIDIGAEQFAYISGNRWSTGTQHHICVRVWSSKGQVSEWSEPVVLSIADPLVCTIASTSLVEETEDMGGGEERTYLALKALPLNVTITGAGTTGHTRLLIRRAEEFRLERPDDDVFVGYKGETIAMHEHIGESTFVVDDSALMFDDEAQYEIVATVYDDYGQTAEAEPLEFEVHWTHQAIRPTATVTVENGIARIVPRANATQGDTVDIYRLSADRPQRILTDGNFNKVYVDPYPTIGEHGGYRVVYKTVNGDYKTDNGMMAWEDVYTNYEAEGTTINFGAESVQIHYNLDESNSWEKDFRQTKYLGGSIQGDWNVGVSQSGSISTVAIVITDADVIASLRRLANYVGVCHVRTQGGASYAADVQVSESVNHDKGHMIYEYSFTVTKVDPVGDEAMLYDEWVRQ